MNTLVKFLAPAAVVMLAFNAQAADQISTGGDTYRGYEVVGDKPDPSMEVAENDRIRTGGATYVGMKGQAKIFVNPEKESWLTERQLDRLYLG